MTHTWLRPTWPWHAQHRADLLQRNERHALVNIGNKLCKTHTLRKDSANLRIAAGQKPAKPLDNR